MIPQTVSRVEILAEKPSRRRHAIFVSAGDRETFATHALDNLSGAFDVFIFFYGASPEKRTRFEGEATLFAAGTATKFAALKIIQAARRSLFEHYETVWVCDDDLVLEHGDYRALPLMQKATGVQVLSPAHSIRGKISHQIMLPELGRHFFRYTSFVEMTCPLFTTEALVRFLEHYDGTLRGYAEDWWFLWVLGANKASVAGIADSVTIINPHNKAKPGGYGEMELNGQREQLRLHWLAAMEKYGMREWPAGTLSYVRHSSHHAPELRRPVRDLLKTAVAMLNYKLRLYGFRKRISLALRARQA